MSVETTENNRKDAAWNYYGNRPTGDVEHWVRTGEGSEKVNPHIVDLARLFAEREHRRMQKASEPRSSRRSDLGKLVSSLRGVDLLPEDTEAARSEKFRTFTTLLDEAMSVLSVLTDMNQLLMKQFQLPQRIVDDWRLGLGPTNMVMTRRASALWLADMVQRHLIEKEEYVEKKPIKVHKLTVLVIDHESYGVESCKQMVMSDDNFHVSVLSAETAEVDWTDDHPLNKHDQRDAAIAALFPKDVT